MTGWSTEQMAARAAMDIHDGDFVNLGIGLPERVADHIPNDREVILHSENGILGMGPAPESPEMVDMELINAGKKPVTLVTGGAFFHHADSFAMIRGGHIDICILGAFEVAVNGDLANWSRGGGTPAVGGAMDLAAGVKHVRVITRHTTRDGAPKLLSELSLPVTGRGVIDRVYTDLGVFDPIGEGFRAVELAPGVSKDAARGATGAELEF